MDYFAQQREKNTDFIDEAITQFLKLKEKISSKMVFKILIVVFSMLLFYFVNKDTSLFKKIFSRS